MESPFVTWATLGAPSLREKSIYRPLVFAFSVRCRASVLRGAMNFKHLHYFWAAAKAGGIVRASEQLHITPQTLSGQIKLLEERLGCNLFQKSGRGVELTPEGRTALSYADQIFALGAELETALG